jgi:rhomboid domain-containing protein 1
VIEGQFYRIITATFSHADMKHIFFNMMTMMIFSPVVEKHHGFSDYLIINILLIIGQHLIALLIMFIMTCVPESLYGGPKYYFSCALGYSGVLYGYLMLWAFTGDKKTNVFGMFKIRKFLIPWIWLFITQIIIPEASFIGHLSGILFAVIIILFFTADEHLCGKGKLNLVRLYQYLKCCKSGDNSNFDDSTQMRRMQIGSSLP